jgi:hypothetical protein
MRGIQFWRLQQHRYRLTGYTCPQCGERSVSVRPVCKACAWPRAQALNGAILLLFASSAARKPEPEMATLLPDQEPRALSLVPR